MLLYFSGWKCFMIQERITETRAWASGVILEGNFPNSSSVAHLIMCHASFTLGLVDQAFRTLVVMADHTCSDKAADRIGRVEAAESECVRPFYSLLPGLAASSQTQPPGIIHSSIHTHSTAQSTAHSTAHSTSNPQLNPQLNPQPQPNPQPNPHPIHNPIHTQSTVHAPQHTPGQIHFPSVPQPGCASRSTTVSDSVSDVRSLQT